MKVLFVACEDSPFDHNAGSGADHEIYHWLESNGAEMCAVGPFIVTQTFAERVYRKVHRMLFKLRTTKYTDSFLNHAARVVEKSIRQNQPDLIFSKYLSIISRVRTDVPIVLLSDTTLAGNQREWPIFTQSAFEKQNRYEKKAYDMAAHILVHSQWSADDLVNSYHQPREKISVYPIPPSIPKEVIPDSISINELTPLKILLNGREYERKGIDIAIETVRKLNDDGIPSLLRIVGLEGTSNDQVQYMGLYNKTIPGQLQAYVSNYHWANFLIHPARFEAAGIVPNEAAAFGVPTITNDVGGLATTVADGVSGVVLPKLSPAESYVMVLKRYHDDPEAYRLLCQSARRRYETEVNTEMTARWAYQICLAASGCKS